MTLSGHLPGSFSTRRVQSVRAVGSANPSHPLPSSQLAFWAAKANEVLGGLHVLYGQPTAALFRRPQTRKTHALPRIQSSSDGTDITLAHTPALDTRSLTHNRRWGWKEHKKPHTQSTNTKTVGKQAHTTSRARVQEQHARGGFGQRRASTIRISCHGLQPQGSTPMPTNCERPATLVHDQHMKCRIVLRQKLRVPQSRDSCTTCLGVG